MLASKRRSPQSVNRIITLLTLFMLLGSAQAGERLRVLVLGDSLSAGYGLAAEDSFPAQLERQLQAHGYDVEIINGGVSGDTTTGGLARLDWALGDKPDAVILELGANDGLRAIDPAVTRKNLAKMLEKLRAQNLPVLLAGMLAPPNLGQDYAKAFNAIYPELAEQYGALLYPFFLEGVATVAQLNQADGIHPTAEGIAIIAERILPAVIQLLEEATS
jgi:acyl-CoA thioesterase-1